MVRKIIHALNRAWNYIYAFFGGYYWDACILCGSNFGGHESDINGASVITPDCEEDESVSICNTCSDKLMKHFNAQCFFEIWYDDAKKIIEEIK